MKKVVLIIVILSFGLILTGCTNKTEFEYYVLQSRANVTKGIIMTNVKDAIRAEDDFVEDNRSISSDLDQQIVSDYESYLEMLPEEDRDEPFYTNTFFQKHTLVYIPLILDDSPILSIKDFKLEDDILSFNINYDKAFYRESFEATNKVRYHLFIEVNAKKVEEISYYLFENKTQNTQYTMHSSTYLQLIDEPTIYSNYDDMILVFGTLFYPTGGGSSFQAISPDFLEEYNLLVFNTSIADSCGVNKLLDIFLTYNRAFTDRELYELTIKIWYDEYDGVCALAGRNFYNFIPVPKVLPDQIDIKIKIFSN